MSLTNPPTLAEFQADKATFAAQVVTIIHPEQRLLKAAEAGLVYLQAFRDFVAETNDLNIAISELSTAIEAQKSAQKK